MRRCLTGILRALIAAISGLSVVVIALGQAQTVDTVPEWQKAAGSKLSFEVASIKPADPAKRPPSSFVLDVNDLFYGGADNPHGHLVAQLSLQRYVSFGYKLWPSREQEEAMLANAPKWMSADEYVINAEAQGNTTKDQMRVMMQSLLADRFKLKVHFERRETQVLALILDKPGKTGPKLNAHPDDVPCDVAKVNSDAFVLPCNIVQAVDRPNNSILMSGRNLTLSEIAKNLMQLRSYFAYPLVDQTGLDGRFDFSLQWTRPTTDPVPDPGTTMQEALQDQLGLKLKSTRVFMDTLVIDHVERPTEN